MAPMGSPSPHRSPSSRHSFPSTRFIVQERNQPANEHGLQVRQQPKYKNALQHRSVVSPLATSQTHNAEVREKSLSKTVHTVGDAWDTPSECIIQMEAKEHVSAIRDHIVSDHTMSIIEEKPPKTTCAVGDLKGSSTESSKQTEAASTEEENCFCKEGQPQVNHPRIMEFEQEINDEENMRQWDSKPRARSGYGQEKINKGNICIACLVCKKSYTQVHHLLQHLKKHQENRRVSKAVGCIPCRIAVANSASLLRHLQRYHGYTHSEGNASGTRLTCSRSSIIGQSSDTSCSVPNASTYNQADTQSSRDSSAEITQTTATATYSPSNSVRKEVARSPSITQVHGYNPVPVNHLHAQDNVSGTTPTCNHSSDQTSPIGQRTENLSAVHNTTTITSPDAGSPSSMVSSTGISPSTLTCATDCTADSSVKNSETTRKRKLPLPQTLESALSVSQENLAPQKVRRHGQLVAVGDGDVFPPLVRKGEASPPLVSADTAVDYDFVRDQVNLLNDGNEDCQTLNPMSRAITGQVSPHVNDVLTVSDVKESNDGTVIVSGVCFVQNESNYSLVNSVNVVSHSGLQCKRCHQTFPTNEQLNGHVVKVHFSQGLSMSKVSKKAFAQMVNMKYQEKSSRQFAEAGSASITLSDSKGHSPSESICTSTEKEAPIRTIEQTRQIENAATGANEANRFERPTNASKHGVDHTKCAKCGTIFVLQMAQIVHKHSSKCGMQDRSSSSSQVDNSLGLRENGPYSCNECPQQFETKEWLEYHQECIHIKLDCMTCPVCFKTFSNINNCDRHYKFTHLQHRQFRCSKCPAAFHEERHLKWHNEGHKPKPSADPISSRRPLVTTTKARQDKRSTSNGTSRVSNTLPVASPFRNVSKPAIHGEPNTSGRSSSGSSYGISTRAGRELGQLPYIQVVCRSKGKLQYKCCICSNTFASHSSFKRHYDTIHLGKKRFICNLCGKCFGQLIQKQKHKCPGKQGPLQSVHSKEAQKKDVESLQAVELETVQSAEEQRENDMSIDIPIEPTTTRKGPMRKPKKVMHSARKKSKMVKATAESFKCPICQDKFSMFYDLTHHSHIFHQKAWLKKCPVCSQRFQSMKYVRAHYLESHQSSQESAEENPCMPVQSSEDILNAPAISRDHNKAQQLECHLCQKIFLSQRFLDKHNLLEHQNPSEYLSNVPTASNVDPNDLVQLQNVPEQTVIMGDRKENSEQVRMAEDDIIDEPKEYEGANIIKRGPDGNQYKVLGSCVFLDAADVDVKEEENKQAEGSGRSIASELSTDQVSMAEDDIKDEPIEYEGANIIKKGPDGNQYKVLGSCVFLDAADVEVKEEENNQAEGSGRSIASELSSDQVRMAEDDIRDEPMEYEGTNITNMGPALKVLKESLSLSATDVEVQKEENQQAESAGRPTVAELSTGTLTYPSQEEHDTEKEISCNEAEQESGRMQGKNNKTREPTLRSQESERETQNSQRDKNDNLAKENSPGRSTYEDQSQAKTHENLPLTEAYEELGETKTCEELPCSHASEGFRGTRASENLAKSHTSEDQVKTHTSEDIAKTQTSEGLPETLTSEGLFKTQPPEGLPATEDLHATKTYPLNDDCSELALQRPDTIFTPVPPKAASIEEGRPDPGYTPATAAAAFIEPKIHAHTVTIALFCPPENGSDDEHSGSQGSGITHTSQDSVRTNCSQETEGARGIKGKGHRYKDTLAVSVTREEVSYEYNIYAPSALSTGATSKSTDTYSEAGEQDGSNNIYPPIAGPSKESLKVKFYSCSICHNTYTSKESLKDHLSQHKQVKPKDSQVFSNTHSETQVEIQQQIEKVLMKMAWLNEARTAFRASQVAPNLGNNHEEVDTDLEVKPILGELDPAPSHIQEGQDRKEGQDLQNHAHRNDTADKNDSELPGQVEGENHAKPEEGNNKENAPENVKTQNSKHALRAGDDRRQKYPKEVTADVIVDEMSQQEDDDVIFVDKFCAAYKCQLCQATFNHSFDLVMHIQDHVRNWSDN